MVAGYRWLLDQIHVFQAFGFLPESRAALDEIAAFVASLELASGAEAG